jgi:type IV pilus assembly protein PilC
MPKFFYLARDKQGNRASGMEEASNQDEALSRLYARELVVINVFPEAAAEKTPEVTGAEVPVEIKVRLKHGGIKRDDLVLFCRQLATLLGAGVTILKSLDIISRQIASRKLYNVIKDLQKSMEAGLSFHESMAKHPRVFTELWVNLVDSGEASGNLSLVLARLAGYLERDAAFKRKIISALIYPVILSCAGLSALLFLSIKVIPTFASLFMGFNIELPALTKMVIAFSSFLVKKWLMIIIVIFAAVFIFRQYVSTKAGRRRYERFLFNLPVFGEFFRTLVIERFTSEMATLVESGVPILYSLEITEHSVGNLYLGDILSKVKNEVREGKPLSQPLETSGFFDPMSVQMISIGEEIGELPNMFKRLNAFYGEFVDLFLTRITSMFEPIMLIVMGGLVGILVAAMFLPIFEITKLAQQAN